jgi:hypothetical protein
LTYAAQLIDDKSSARIRVDAVEACWERDSDAVPSVGPLHTVVRDDKGAVVVERCSLARVWTD